MTRLAQPSTPSLRTRALLSERNPHDWVGIAHNHAIDDFRKELRKPGVLTHRICDYLIDFMASSDRVLAAPGNVASVDRRPAARAGKMMTPLCRDRPGNARTVSAKGGESSGSPQESSISPAAYAVLATVETAIDSAADRYDLASRLVGVLDAAAALDSVDRAVIGATVSTAQYSYEYWESQLVAFQQEVWDEYSRCASQLEQSGLSPDEVRDSCIEGGSGAVLAPPADKQSRQFVYASVFRTVPEECSLRYHFSRLAKVDAMGAVVGAIKGLLAGPGGVLAGAFAGGGYASLGSFLDSTWTLHWCAIPKET